MSLKPWFWRIRGTKYIPASPTGWAVLLFGAGLIIAGLNLAVFSLMRAYLVTSLLGAALVLFGFAVLIWSMRHRSAKHPKSRWRE